VGKINWGRVFLCGIVTWGISFLLNFALFVFAVGETEFAAVRQADRPTITWVRASCTFAVGIWTMWLYAAIRPRYGPGPKTAAMAGVALWVIAALAAVLWVSSGLTTISLGALLVPLVAALPTIIVGTLAGAWLYKE